MEAVAKHDFKATAEDELSFKKGGVIKVINIEDDPNWYKAEIDGVEGFIPSNYIDVLDHPWYVGKMGRKDAEDFLLKGDKEAGNCPLEPDGAFLVRCSESTPGDFSLSVKYQTAVQHFKVLRDGSGKYFLWVTKFSSLNALIDYHRTATVSRSQDIQLKDMVQLKKTELVRALFDFIPEEEEELPFGKGEIIQVTGKVDDNWWRGEIDGRSGLFPKTYVKAIPKK